MANIDFPLNPTVGQRYTFAGVTYTFSAQGVWSPAAVSIVTQSIPQGRLTLQPGVPVMTTTSTGHTAMYYTPYVGNRIPIWDGVAMAMRGFSELSTTTVDFTNNPAPLAANKVNDWFVFRDPPNSNMLRICHGPDWTDDVTRSPGTVLIRVEGLLLNNVAITNGPAAQRGTYVGTTLSDANGQLSWIYGARGIPPTAGFFGVWNAYFRVAVNSLLGDGTATWTYALQLPRQINGNTQAKFTYVTGIAEDTVTGEVFMTGITDPSTVLLCGVGFDVANAYSGAVGLCYNTWGQAFARFSTPSIGKHVMSCLEGNHVNTATPSTIMGGLWPAGGTGLQTGMYFDGRF